MKNTEKLVLQEIIKNLDNSTITNWNYGDLDDWRDLAKKMKITIQNSVSILKTLVSDENKSEDEDV